MDCDVFLICPVAGTSLDGHPAEDYVSALEKIARVHWPIRDTDQIDPIGGYRILGDNVNAIAIASVVHQWFDPGSRGSLFDLGAAFALGKPYVLANPEYVYGLADGIEGKCFEKAALQYYHASVLRAVRGLYGQIAWERLQDNLSSGLRLTAGVVSDYPSVMRDLLIPHDVA